MDSNFLELFSLQEVLERLAEKTSTGSLHVFTPREAANLIFKEGVIIGAAKGLLEGEEVLKQILDWKDVRALWQAGDVAAMPNAKPVQIEVADFLFKLKVAPKIAIGGKTLSEASPSSKRIMVESARMSSSFIPVPRVVSNGTGKVAASEPVVTPTEAPIPVAATPMLTATKSMYSVPQMNTPHEESLLRKHKLALVSTDEGPKRRVGITQMSMLVGRNPACDFLLEHGSVSRQHCLLQITDRGLHVKDLGTTNGTKVNGIVLTEGYINVGDKLTIGKLTYLLDKEPDEVEV